MKYLFSQFKANHATAMSTRKQILTPHQKQMRFLTFFFGAIVVLIGTGFLLFLNRGNLVAMAR